MGLLDTVLLNIHATVSGQAGVAELGRGISGLNTQLLNLNSGLQVLGQVVSGVQNLAGAAKGWADEANRANTATMVFEQTIRRFGMSTESASTSAEKLAARFGLTVQDVQDNMTTLIRAGFRDMDSLEKVMTGAAASAIAAGRTAKDGFNAIADATTTGLSTILNGIGISQNVSTYTDKLAKSLGKQADQLTDTEKAQAIYNLTMDATSTEVEALDTIMNQYVRSQQQADLAQKQLQRNMGEIFMPILARFNTALADVTGTVSEMISTMRSGGSPLDALMLRFPQLAGVLGKVGEVAGQLREGLMSTFNGSILPMLERLAPKVQATSRVLQPAFKEIGAVILRLGGLAEHAFKNVLIPLVEALAPIVLKVVERAVPYLASLGRTFVALWEMIATYWERIALPIIQQIAPVVERAVDRVANVLTGVVTAVRNIWDAVRHLIEGDWSAAWDSLKNAVGHAVLAVQEALKGVVEAANGMVTGLFTLLDKKADELWTQALKFGSGIGDAVVRGFSNVKNGIQNAIVNALKGALALIPKEVTDALKLIGVDLDSAVEKLRPKTTDAGTGTGGSASGNPTAGFTKDKGKAIQAAARILNVDPNDLAAVISFETAGKLDPNIRNPKSSATGLIQFMKAEYAGKYGMSRDEFGGLSFEKQMEYVVRYLKERGIGQSGKTSLAAIYEAVAGSGYRQGSEAYRLNRVWDANKDGVIRPGEQIQSAAFQAHRRNFFGGSGGGDDYFYEAVKGTYDPKIKVKQQAAAEEWTSAFVGGLVNAFQNDPNVDSDCAIIAARVMGRLGVHLEGEASERINAGKLVQQVRASGAEQITNVQALKPGDYVDFSGPQFGKTSGHHAGIVVGVRKDGTVLILNNAGGTKGPSNPNGRDVMTKVDAFTPAALAEIAKQGGKVTYYRPKESPYATKAQAEQAEQASGASESKATNALVNMLDKARQVYLGVDRLSANAGKAAEVYAAALRKANAEAQAALKRTDLSREDRQAYTGVALRAKKELADLTKQNDALKVMNDRLEVTRTNLTLAAEGTQAYTDAQQAHRKVLAEVVRLSEQRAGKLKDGTPEKKALAESLKNARSELSALDAAIRKGDGAAEALRTKQEAILRSGAETAARNADAAQRGYDKALKAAGENTTRQLETVRREGALLQAAREEQGRKTYELAVQQANTRYRADMAAAAAKSGAERATLEETARVNRQAALETAAENRRNAIRDAQTEQAARLEAAKKGVLGNAKELAALRGQAHLAALAETVRQSQAETAALQASYEQQRTLAAGNAARLAEIERTTGSKLKAQRLQAARDRLTLERATANEALRLARQSAAEGDPTLRAARESQAQQAHSNAYRAADAEFQASVRSATDTAGNALRESEKTLQDRLRTQAAMVQEYQRGVTEAQLKNVEQNVAAMEQARDRNLTDAKDDALARLQIEEDTGAQILALQLRAAEASRNLQSQNLRANAEKAKRENAETFKGNAAGLAQANAAIDAKLRTDIATLQATYLANVERLRAGVANRLSAAQEAWDKQLEGFATASEKAVADVLESTEKLFQSGTTVEEQARNRADAAGRLASALGALTGLTIDPSTLEGIDHIGEFMDYLLAQGVDLEALGPGIVDQLDRILSQLVGFRLRAGDFLPVEEAVAFRDALIDVGVAAQDANEALDGAKYTPDQRSALYDGNVALQGNDLAGMEAVSAALGSMDSKTLPAALRALKMKLDTAIGKIVDDSVQGALDTAAAEIEGELAALERGKAGMSEVDYSQRRQGLLLKQLGDWSTEEDRLREEGKTETQIQAAHTRWQNQVTAITEAGERERAAIRLRLRRESEDLTTQLATDAAQHRYAMGLTSEREYIAEQARLQRQAAATAYSRAVEDATDPLTGRVDLAAKGRAITARNAAYIRIEQQRQQAERELTIRNTRALQDAVTQTENAAREERHRLGLVSEAAYQREAEDAEVMAALRAYNRAVEDAKGDADLKRTASLNLEAELTRIRAKGAEDRRSIAEREADFEVAQGRRALDRSYGLDTGAQQRVVSALQSKVDEARKALNAPGLVEGTDAYTAALGRLQQAEDDLTDAKALPNTLSTWSGAIQKLGEDFASRRIDAQTFTATLAQLKSRLVALGDAAEKAGDPATAKAFRDMAAGLRAMSPEVTALLGKMQAFTGYLEHFQQIAGALGQLTAALGAAEQEYDSVTGEKLQTPWKDVTANIEGAVKAAQTLMGIATDVMKIVANPADIGAWVGLITKVVSSIADAISGFKKARAEVSRLTADFAASNPLLNAGDYQKAYTRSRGWFADVFGGGPEVVNEIDKIGLPIAQTLAGHVASGVSSGFDAYLQTGNMESFTKALQADLTRGFKDALVQGFMQDPARKNEYASLIKSFTDAWKSHDPARIMNAARAIYGQTQATTEAAKQLAAQLDELDRLNGTGRHSPEAQAEKARQAAEQLRSIAEQENELLFTQGKRSQAEYEAEKLRLTLERIRLQMEAELARLKAEGASEEELARIRRAYALQGAQAQADYDRARREATKQLAKDLTNLQMNNAETALNLEEKLRLSMAATEDEKYQIQLEYARRRQQLTLERLNTEEAAELALVDMTLEGAQAMVAAIRERYRLAREGAGLDLKLLEQQVRAAAEQTAQSWRQSLTGGVSALLNGDSPLQALYDGVRGRIAQAIQEGFVVKRILVGLDPLFKQLDDALSQGIDPRNIIASIGAALPGLSVEIQGTLGPLFAQLNASIPQLTNAVNGNTAALREAQFQQTYVVQYATPGRSGRIRERLGVL